MARDPEKERAYSKAYYEANREKLLARQKARHATNPEKRRAYSKAYRATNPERAWCISAVSASRKRARAKGIPHTVDRAYLESIWTDTCPVLGVPFNLAVGSGVGSDSATLDCFDPVKGYVPGNVCIISHRANTIKYDVTDPTIIERVTHYVRNPHLYVPNWSPDG